MWVLGIELGTLEEQSVLLTAEPSLQPLELIFVQSLLQDTDTVPSWDFCIRANQTCGLSNKKWILADKSSCPREARASAEA